MTSKFYGWPWKIIGHLFYATSSFVHHFLAIGEIKLELQSGNNFGKNQWFYVPCDLEIWQMSLKNIRAPLPCYFKLCASFCNHQYLPNCRFWPTAYGDTIGATTGVNISDIVWVVDPSDWSRHMQSSRLYCLYWLLCTWCTPGSGADQELSVRVGQALPWTCQQEFWFDSSGGWVGCWIAEVLWCQMKLIECFEYVGEQMGGHLEHGKFWLDEDAILKRFWLGFPRCCGHCLPGCAMYIVGHTFRTSFQENIGWETVVGPSRKDAACL